MSLQYKISILIFNLQNQLLQTEMFRYIHKCARSTYRTIHSLRQELLKAQVSLTFM